MHDEKRTYYVSIESGEVLEEPAELQGYFKINATGEEVKHLREFMNENYKADLQTFVRSHIPFKEYHKDKEDVKYDKTMDEVYALIYELGDQEARDHIRNMGILDESLLKKSQER
ncbi:hydrolase [Bacillus sp. T33-2]|uniref:hydrolase n=1 Tax=Bacillus sp. T33-2 TaxID=2054168 RepID=UPI000C772F5E|nr:hydrolase [Bacillus sp. T33-2]PLR97678.1 hydrolase [Bacillus sp. T33-2]